MYKLIVLCEKFERDRDRERERDGKRQTAREREKERYRVYHKNGDNLHGHLQYNIAHTGYS